MEKIEIEQMLQNLGNRKDKSIQVAIVLGKNPVNSGPIAQARKDGYEVAIRDAILALNKI